jgi:uncharacterized membrane protein
MRRSLALLTVCSVLSSGAVAGAQSSQPPKAPTPPAKAVGAAARRDTLTAEERRAIREASRDARSMSRRRSAGDSAVRAARNAEAATTAFESPEARAIFERARAAREQQDSALKSYRATTTQRMSVGLGARRLGFEKLLFRGDNVAEITWRRDVGVRVRPIGSRMTVPMGGETTGDFVSAISIPYFPGREQLWFPSSDFGVVKTDVDEREMIHPLARGAERYYRYATGDSANITLPDGRIIRLRELRIAARKPEWRSFVGSFWFDADGGQLVRAAYRMASEIDIWSVASEETEKDIAERIAMAPVQDSLLRARLPRDVYVKDSTRRAAAARQRQGEDDKPPAWVMATFRPMKASLDAITVEYALYKGKFWLPRMHSATANAEAMFMRIPVRFDEKFSYEDVDGDFTLRALPPTRNRFAAKDSAKADSLAVDLGSAGVEVSVSSSDRKKTPAQRDSIERRRYGAAKVRQCAKDSVWTRVEERYEGAVRIAYDLPCDMSTLEKSKALPALDASDADVFDMASAERLVDALGMSLQTPWAPQLPKVRVGSDLVRYNRIEGLSVGAEVKQVLGAGYTLTGVGRFGVADRHANGELTLARSTGLRTVSFTGYHRLLAANPDWAGALSFAPSLPAFLYGRDEGFYYRAMGASLGEHREQRKGSLDYRLFIERQWTAGDSTVVNTFSLARAFGDRRFAPNIIAEPSTFTGVDVTWARTLLDRPRGWRLVGITRGEAATGTFEYARGSLETTVSHPLGQRALFALTGSAGSSVGRLPIQRNWYLGGLRTVRGQFPGTQNGDAYWFGRAELGTRQGFARPVLFYDMGWAGSRKAFGEGMMQRGAGIGFGLLDGLIRLDFARGLNPAKRWRTDIYLGAPL